MEASELVREIERADFPPLTLESLKEELRERGFDEAVVLENPDYLSAIVGVSEDGRVVYDYDGMVRHLMEQEGMDAEEAAEFVDYNTIRALPYMGDKRPIVVYGLEEI